MSDDEGKPEISSAAHRAADELLQANTVLGQRILDMWLTSEALRSRKLGAYCLCLDAGALKLGEEQRAVLLEDTDSDMQAMASVLVKAATD